MKLKSLKILIAISGGIAVYKICSLITSLLSEGADIEIIMTDSAKKFVTPLTFESLNNKKIFSELWDDSGHIKHIELAKWPDVVIVAPATANTISKISNGIADNLLTTVILALPSKTPIFIVPAMNTNMWNNKIIKDNINKLITNINVRIIDPRRGLLACRDEGVGKIASNETIVDTIKSL